jgi:hypothetical protein
LDLSGIKWQKAGEDSNEELHNSYTSTNIFRVIKRMMMKWVEYVVCMREMRYAYKILVEKPEEKRPLR